MTKSWKSALQELCQKNNLPMPNYRIDEQRDAAGHVQFRAAVDVNGAFYTGDEACSKKKDAEHSAAEKAYHELIQEGTPSLSIDPEGSNADGHPNQHMPPEHADIERFFTELVGESGGRIRRVRAPDQQHKHYLLEITGPYRYCDNVKREHLNNQIYFLVDVEERVYYQRCHDPDCRGFQSARKLILADESNGVPH